jgi:hypothetical protein
MGWRATPSPELTRSRHWDAIAGFARALVESNWSAIGKVAEVLARCRRMTYFEVGRLAR